MSCAYWSFLLSEGALHISGVLCTVTSALVLADKMWPVIVDKESMHHVWHMFEYLGNTVIFFLAGALTGNTMIVIPFVDYLHLLVIYVFACLVRGTVIFCSRPLLTCLSHDREPVSLADCLIMTWGGLRGAVGLALAIQVKIDRAGGTLSELNANRVLFYTGGIASLTLIVNALTCPKLVEYLKITKTPAAKKMLMLGIHHQLETLMQSKHPATVTKRGILQMLEEAREHIHEQTQEKLRKNSTFMTQLQDYFLPARDFRCHTEFVDHHIRAVNMLNSIPQKSLKVLDLPKLPLVDQHENLKTLAKEGPTEPRLVQAVNEAFLKLLRAQYWEQIEAGEFVSGTRDVEMLLNSVQLAFKHAGTRLADFDNLKTLLGISEDNFWARKSSRTKGSTHISHISGHLFPGASEIIDGGEEESCLIQFINSTGFTILMAITIVLCAIFIAIEQAQGDNVQNYVFWLVVEITFNAAFTAEFIIKFLALKFRYFYDGWNIFDFVLVLVGLAGVVLEFIMNEDNDNDISTKHSLFRINRVFRVLRIIRVLRLFKFFQLLKAKLARKSISLELAEHLQLITVFRAFTKAHAKAEEELIRFLGNNGEVQSCEEARCILESQVHMCRAIALAAAEADEVDRKKLADMQILRESIHITEGFEAFIMDGHRQGILNAREAACILHPLHKGIRGFHHRLCESTQGFDTSESCDAIAFDRGSSNASLDSHDCHKHSMQSHQSTHCGLAKIVPEG